MIAALNEYAGALALLALVLCIAAVVLLIVLLVRQKRQAHGLESMLHRQESMERTALGETEYRQGSEMQYSRLVQLSNGQEQRQNAQIAALRESVMQRLDAFGVSQENSLRQNEERIERMRGTVAQALANIQQDNARKLDEIRRTVDEKLNETLDKRLSASFSQVSQRLEQVYAGLGEMRTLASGVGDLKKVLTNVKSRGIWGEMQLGALLGQMLAPEQYLENTPVEPESAQRVEYAVVLPGQGDGRVLLPIDSKFPLEDYERLLTAYETAEQMNISACLTALAGAVRREAKRIAEKYIVPPYTTDFAILFLPTEGLYAEVLRMRGLAEELQEKLHIVIAGPTTLCALLTALQTGFRTLAIEKRSGEVWKLLGAVKTEFGVFAQTLELAQKKMHAAEESIENATRRSRSIEKQLRQVESGESEALPDTDENERSGV